MDKLSLLELKQLAKQKKIKQYYILKQSELIELLTMQELPIKYKLEKMTIKELRATAKERGLRGFWGLSKKEITELLFPTHDKQQNNSQTSEHGDPQNEDPNKVVVEITEDTLEQRLNNMNLNE
jgi:hypothetical protein